MSCTDLQAVWPMPTLSTKVPVVPVSDMDWGKCSNIKQDRTEISALTATEVGNLLKKCSDSDRMTPLMYVIDPFEERKKILKSTISKYDIFDEVNVTKSYSELISIAKGIDFSVTMEDILEIEKASRHQSENRNWSPSTVFMETIIKNSEASQFLRDISEEINCNSTPLESCCKAVLESLKETDIMKVAIDYPQGSDKWKEERQLRITGKENHNRDLKRAAYTKLVEKLKTIDPRADKDAVVKKINNIRSTYKKERKKIADSKKSEAGTQEVYKPKLWYYSMLLFLDDQEEPRRSRLNMDDESTDNGKTTSSLYYYMNK
ncbi:unnamed protein product [Phaedon cochleariae]|uniref:MADF domain-containing protein n=1 Tax=Phaedon cochleariae TaxID=80249 RepID=A0A9N9SCP9_PHACE|nr:unnamed protein product [Phaedon cochleariae]